jgi:formiminoglutamase
MDPTRHVSHSPPDGLSGDREWLRAGEWLSAGVADTDPVDVTVIGVPVHRTSLSTTGAHRTPTAVREALWRYSTFAPSRQADLAALRIRDLGDCVEPDDNESSTQQVVRGASAISGLTVLLGGDNSLTFAGALGAFGDDLSTAGLVTLDAHHDVRDGVSNGSPVRRLVEAGLDPRRIVQVGIADFANSAVYAKRATDWGIRVMSVEDVRRRGMTACMRDALEIAGRAGGPVYVDLDVDVCDRAVAPACPASVPGGISAAELREAAHLAGLNRQVRTVDIAEVDATADTADARTVRLAALCVLEACAGVVRRRAG